MTLGFWMLGFKPVFSLFSFTLNKRLFSSSSFSAIRVVLSAYLRFAQTHVQWVNDAIQPSHPLLLPSPPALNLSQHQGLFQWDGSSHQVAKVLEFSFSISPDEYSGLISFGIDCFDILAVQRTLKSLLQQGNSKASILWCSASVMVQLCIQYTDVYSHLYLTTGKIIALTLWTFVSKVMTLLFNMLPRFVIVSFQGASVL